MQYNTMSYVGIDSLHKDIFQSVGRDVIPFITAAVAFSHSQLNVFMLYKWDICCVNLFTSIATLSSSIQMFIM
jgi:hypothetical protein